MASARRKPMKKARRELPVHPLLLVLGGALAILAALQLLGPTRDRRQALEHAHERSGTRDDAARLTPTPQPTPDADTPLPLVLEDPSAPFESWYRDEVTEPGRCALEQELRRAERLEVHRTRFTNGMELLLSKQDLAFLAWVAFQYDLNPHFLLAIMMVESAGDCSAVSSAGAQGCFQITYRQGAGQLKNSFAERVASWYWARRSNVGDGPRRPGEALGYWPADLYVPPEKHFGMKLKKGFRQLRMTLDPAATLLDSDRKGLTEVSSVASFSFGVNGAGLYFHFLNYYLYSHEVQLKGDVRELVSVPEEKVRWMAAAYNQGAPRTMRTLGRVGPKALWRNTHPDVLLYADMVTDYCEQLQLGDSLWGGTLRFGEFSDWLQQLRWTYSEVKIDWDGLQRAIQVRYFGPEGRGELDLQTQLLEVFRFMRARERGLEPEKPRLDHKVRF